MPNLYTKKIGVTNNSDFKDHAKIGSDYLYQRWDSVYAVINHCIKKEEYKFFLARPEFDKESDTISWYTKDWGEELSPIRIGQLNSDQAIAFHRIYEETLGYYKSVAEQLHHDSDGYKILNRVIKNLDNQNYIDNFVFAIDNYVVCVAWGMSLLDKSRTKIDSIIMGLPKPKYTIRFAVEKHGELRGYTNIRKYKGYTISKSDIPDVKADQGYEFTGWDNEPENYVVKEDTTFIARISNKEGGPIDDSYGDGNFTIHFVEGEHGSLSGQTTLIKSRPYTISAGDIPKVSPAKGYEFIGWDTDPIGCEVLNDLQFTAQYKRSPWYKRFWLGLLGFFAAFWLWFRKHGWKWLLLLLLLILLCCLLLRSCGNKAKYPSIIDDDDQPWVSGDDNVRLGHGGIYDPGNPYQEIPNPTAPGSGYEDLEPILPGRPNEILPIEGDPVFVPGRPTIIENRLNLLMENREKSIFDLIRAFKAEYPSDDYKVVYYDDVIKRIQIEVPTEEREELKLKIPSQFAEFQVFVYDETLFEGAYIPNDPAVRDEQSWYLNAVEAFEAWDITRGVENIAVAVVDNGFNLNHPEFNGKIVMPYNVWTHNDEISMQDVDHGTHVAGIAIGNADNKKGISGIAPKCKFMPIQVADKNGIMTTTSVSDGIIYALYQGADVINVSLGLQFPGLEYYPESEQKELINNHFKEEERLWREIMRIAEMHNNATVVIAAGNDNVLAGIEAMQRPEMFVTVSAVDKTMSSLKKADFSNYGEYSTVSAPGVDIYSCYKDNYESMPGTSMAAPIVTGAIALMKSIKKDITNEQIICTLQSTGKPVRDNIGNLIQINKALQKIVSGDIGDCAPIPSSGDVQILLSWNNYNDLDLICIDPYNDYVYFQQKMVPSGGQLEIDMNAGGPQSNHPIENIYWPHDGAPNGTYYVELLYYAQHEPSINRTPYQIIVRYGEKEETYEGFIEYYSYNEPISICSFTL